jgi:hypothetical protein
MFLSRSLSPNSEFHPRITNSTNVRIGYPLLVKICTSPGRGVFADSQVFVIRGCCRHSVMTCNLHRLFCILKTDTGSPMACIQVLPTFVHPNPVSQSRLSRDPKNQA